MKKKYAELLIKKGVNIQQNQYLVIFADVENAPFVRLLTEVALEIGAKDVIVSYSDEQVSKMRYTVLPLEHFCNIPKHVIDLRNEYAKLGAAFLTLVGGDPDLFKDVDPMKMSTYSREIHKQCAPFYDSLDFFVNRWCIAGCPTVAWANKVFPGKENALDLLWEAVFKTCKVDEHVLENWDQYRTSFEERVNILNHAQLKSLHYTNSKGTDLTVGLVKDYLFAGGGDYTKDGIYYFPNIPTVEIFGSPDRNAINGIVYNSLPLNHNGIIIDDFYLKFEKGRICDYDAKVGYDALRSIIETDEGSHYLGEIALVPYTSPINNLGILFYETLYDENASCHLAIGKGFSECIKDGIHLSKEELLEKGINDSNTHVDFMIGTKDLSIIGKDMNDESFIIFKDGEFVF